MLAIFGDSMQEWSNSVLGGATYSIGIRDTWRCNWIGAAVHPDGGKNDIVGRHFALGSAFIGGWSGYDDPVPDQPAWSPGAPASLGDVRAPSTPNGFVYSCTAAGWCGGAEPAWPINLGCSVQDGSATWTAFALAGNYYPIASVARSPSFTPTCVMTTSPTAPMISAYSQFARLATEPGELTQFNSTGDWSSNNLACDMIFYRCPTGFRGDAGGDADTFSLVSLRGGAVANTASGLTCFSPAGSEQWAAYSVTAPAGYEPLEVYARTGAASSTPTTVYFGGSHLYIPDEDEPISGTELLPIGGNGSATAMDLRNIQSQRPQDLVSWCKAWRLDRGAVCMLMMGQNLSPSEMASIRVTWKQDMGAIITQLRSAITAIPGAVSPLFLLVSAQEPASPQSLQVGRDMEQALYELSQENPDVGYCNLRGIAMRGANALKAGFFAEPGARGAHPSRPNSVDVTHLSGVDYYAGLIWGELCRAYYQTPATIENR